MTWNVWFLPSNNSHAGKNLALLRGLQGRGHRVSVLCLDRLHSPAHASLPQVEAGGLPFEILDPGGFRWDKHWAIQGLRRGVLVRALKRFFMEHEVDVAIFGADSGIVSRTAGDVARSLGIPTALVVDGLVARRNPEYWRRRSLGLKLRDWFADLVIRRILRAGGGGRTSGVDLLLVMSELAREELILRGVSGERVRAVGSPEYDALARQWRQWESEGRPNMIRERMSIAPDRPVIFFAHQDIGLDEEIMRRSVVGMVRAARRVGGTLLMKLHPRGGARADDWRGWARGEGFSDRDIVVYANECTSIEAVAICSVCVTFYSTVAVESMVFGKPVVLLIYHGFKEFLSAADFRGGALDTHSPEEAENQLVRVLSDPATGRDLTRGVADYLRTQMFGLDGHSVDRSVDAIVKLVEKRPRAVRRQVERGIA